MYLFVILDLQSIELSSVKTVIQRLRSPGILRRKYWQFLTDVSGQPTDPETSVRNYQSTVRNIAEERSSHLYRGGSLKSLVEIVTCDLYLGGPHFEPRYEPGVARTCDGSSQCL